MTTLNEATEAQLEARLAEADALLAMAVEALEAIAAWSEGMNDFNAPLGLAQAKRDRARTTLAAIRAKTGEQQ